AQNQPTLARDVTAFAVGADDEPEPVPGVDEFERRGLGVEHPEAETLEFVDAGHGLWFVVGPDGECRDVACEGGLVLGIQPDAAYRRESVPFPRGSRLIVFSDGLPEQRNPDGEQFGRDRATKALRSSKAPRDDVVALARAVRDHAETDSLSDDLTIASVAYVAE
ncbi:MAG: serine/threonine-protein phosphatase, partial [Phycisphaerales bacterium]|nr:serine/threonine-protein phosphatase [Phycisphaerales bacterium]